MERNEKIEVIRNVSYVASRMTDDQIDQVIEDIINDVTPSYTYTDDMLYMRDEIKVLVD